MPTDEAELTTVVVVTWNGADLLPPCLDSLAAQTLAHRVLVVDNASTDATAELLARDYPSLGVIRLPVNAGFAGGADAGLRAADTPYVALLNNDAVAEPQWLRALVDAVDRDDSTVAVTGRMLLSSDGRVNNAGGALTRWGVGYDRGLGAADGPRFDSPVEVAAFSGGAAVLRRTAVDRVGGFATSFFLYYEDTDLSWRLRRAGGRIRYVPDAVVHHRHSATTDQSSELFAFYNQRNQLLTLVRNAPMSLVVANLVRFLVVTLVRAVRPGLGHQGDARHRVRVLRAVAASFRAALADRRRADATAVMNKWAFCRDWLGVEQR